MIFKKQVRRRREAARHASLSPLISTRARRRCGSCAGSPPRIYVRALGRVRPWPPAAKTSRPGSPPRLDQYPRRPGGRPRSSVPAPSTGWRRKLGLTGQPRVVVVPREGGQGALPYRLVPDRPRSYAGDQRQLQLPQARGSRARSRARIRARAGAGRACRARRQRPSPAARPTTKKKCCRRIAALDPGPARPRPSLRVIA